MLFCHSGVTSALRSAEFDDISVEDDGTVANQGHRYVFISIPVIR